MFQEIALLHPCIIFSKNFILLLIDKVTTGKWSFALFIWNVALFVVVATSYLTGLEFETTLHVLDTSDITQYFDHDKSSSISWLIKGKSRDLQKLLKYFNGTTTSSSNVPPLSGVFPINFVL